MTNHRTVFRFRRSVAMRDVEATLLLSQLAVASLHGDDRVRLQAQMHVNRAGRTCEIDTSSPVGQDLALIFAGYVRREFGEEAIGIHLAMAGMCDPAGSVA
jgi:hypothetical protein